MFLPTLITVDRLQFVIRVTLYFDSLDILLTLRYFARTCKLVLLTLT